MNLKSQYKKNIFCFLGAVKPVYETWFCITKVMMLIVKQIYQLRDSGHNLSSDIQKCIQQAGLNLMGF